ncbi:MAG: hypothetical protein COS89_03695 [Deltaproteobacteria bacterium CG07_land_8_20_14_0_80_38_7]|nr:MAG: hypothetical protein COS89_03695 [Deltaproteobacteria bacterium CG07_land_8_20_14_0_80_38_7]
MAEVTISAALNIAKDSLAKRYGTPVQKNGDKARYAVVAFGRFGSSEIDYGSDLDLCFLYSENGNTTGPEKITNAEFFTRLSQRIISLISVNSRYGRAYEIDSDLRPSGKQGSLVATLNTFLEHYQDSSDVWGKLALLKSRAIASDKEFIKHVNSSISNIAYNINIPLETLIKEIDHLVSKSTKETDIENENQFSFKTSRGSLFELNYIIQLLQIMSLKRSQDIRTQNSFYIINELTKTSTVDHETISQISEIYLFYRTVLSRLRLLTESSSDTLNFDSPHINSLASSLGFSENKTFVTKIIQYHKKTREIFTGLIDKKI